ncbi:MAG: response regulator [Methanoregulaceae archaeon]|nr:response regulator [Methanoregulaceae archaeon]
MSGAKRQGMVYVIDDDDSVRKALKRLFRSGDLDVETFPSAEEFLSAPRQERKACILIDIRMPGLTGFDLQQRLASQGMGIPVIVISASDDVQTRERARELGAEAFFRKPVDDQALLDAIWWALAGSGKKR